MRSRPTFLILFCLLLLAVGAWLFWPSHSRRVAHENTAPPLVGGAPKLTFTSRSASTAPLLLGCGNDSTNGVVKTNQFAWRLSNTKLSIGQLQDNPRAILLENALIDTGSPLNFFIPKNLQAQGDPGAYIVQANRPLDNAFRAMLAAAGAQIVSYIPNNAYLVTVSSGGAAGLASQPDVQSVLPFEPYYKLPASLMPWVGETFPADRPLRVAAYPNTADSLKSWLANSGAQIVAEEPSSPFGQTFIIQNVTDIAVLARQPVLQRVEPVSRRTLANDLARVTLGISANTVTPTNYLGLSGKNVVVEVNDTGIDAAHPDFDQTGSAGHPGSGPSRIIPDSALSMVDTNGHGTHVAGIIAGNGSESYTLNGHEPRGSVTNADFRGKAPAAYVYSVAALDNSGGVDISDYYLQSAPALTNALISNNSWTYDDTIYDLAAASYDAAVRDALPFVTGSQPVLFVFAAGNDGGGQDDGTAGSADTIQSPGTAKNVITVGALEQLRNITNTYTPLGSTNQVAAWKTETDNPNQVAGYSARGNVGVGFEGASGRFKPDVVAPGSFVVSTRSSEWDQAAYYNPTNYYFESISDQFVSAGSQNNYSLSLNFVPPNTTFHSNIVAVNIQIVPNANSPTNFPNLPIYVSHLNYPTTNTYDFFTTNNQVSIPPDGGGSYLATIQGGNLFYTIVNTNNERVGYDLIVEITATNQNGNYFTVLSNLNNSLGTGPNYYYRYESGTSMSAPAVSGTLALMQDYLTNQFSSPMRPSPALLKAMLINGARPVGSYTYAIASGLNFEGWGLVNLPDSLPAGINNQISTPCSTLFRDQSPTSALATGDSQSFTVAVNATAIGDFLPLEVTLAWTDPPGNPAAAIKLVNNLDLMISNNVTGQVYFGNDIAPGFTYNQPWVTNTTPNLDSVNNVENIIIPPQLGGSYTVTVIGRDVNVNAVTAQTNNVVQDYALVIACGEGEVPNAITVTPSAPVSNPTSDQQITVVQINPASGAATNGGNGGVFLGQLAGANTPLLGTNTVGAGSSFASNAVITVGMTNQWHFYIVTNATTFTNAAFVTFSPDTLSIPRMGVYADSDANATQPEADIDLYVATGTGAAGLTNLDPNVISNCVNGLNGDGASLSRGGTEFVAYTNSQPNQVYYVGVKSETAEAAEYGFLPVFSQQQFSGVNSNGTETVNGLLLPVSIPDGTPALPGVAYVFALALQTMQVQNVVVSNSIIHQHFGDLTGTLSHDGKGVVLNNHDSLGSPPGPYNFIYDDSPSPVAGSQPPDGPGTLQSFQGQQAAGPWILTEVDNSFTQTGMVTGFSLVITPQQNLLGGITVIITNGGFFYGFIDVPAGTTNLTISATNISPTVVPPPGQLFEKFGEQPEPPPTPPTNFDKMVTLTNGVPPGGSISIGPSDSPPIQPGRYYVTLYNPSASPQTFFIKATLGIAQVTPVNFNSTGPVPLLDDAVTYAYITNYPAALPPDETIAEIGVGIRVDHPRISDLVFHLISPDGTRYLLMENRGGTSTNGAGLTIYTTNTVNVVASGNNGSNTNVVDLNETQGTFPITYNFFTVPDQMTVYYGTNLVPDNLIYNSGLVSGSGSVVVGFPPPLATEISSNLTIVMNQFGNPATNGDLWTYTAGGISTNYYYLDFTEDTNLTTTPIKFAPPPFLPANFFSTNFVLSDFESAPANEYLTSATVDGWHVAGNQVSVVNDPTNAQAGSKFLALANGTISNSIPMVPGETYTLSFAYRGPGIAGWWRGENNANDSIGGNNGILMNNGVNFIPGEVGTAFNMNGVNGYVLIQSTNSALNVGQGGGFTMEGWINPTSVSGNLPIFEYENNLAGGGSDVGVHFYAGLVSNPGELYYNIIDTTGNNHSFVTTSSYVIAGTWQHIALTYNKTSGMATLYYNGQAVAQNNYGSLTPQTTYTNLLIGARTAFGSVASPSDKFPGGMDEMSVYSRALSASEIKTIYNHGSAGKFDASFFNTSPAQSLAEATVSVPGVSTNIIFGNNTTWQSQTITFTATGTTTPLIISGVEPGMLLDSFSVSGIGGLGNIYYQPEQDISPLIGTSAYGLWTLEVLDDRAGATNNTVLDSWQLQFVFANTNPVVFVTNTVTLPVQTNFIVNVSTLVIVTNTATDSDTNAVLTYVLVNPPAGATINPTNGIITWPNATPAGLAARFTTIVTDSTSFPPVSATNMFTVFVAPFPSITKVTATSTNVVLQWTAPTSDQFEVQWATNLAPVIVWNTFPPVITSANGMFSFTDTNAPLVMKFYRLLLLP